MIVDKSGHGQFGGTDTPADSALSLDDSDGIPSACKSDRRHESIRAAAHNKRLSHGHSLHPKIARSRSLSLSHAELYGA